MGEIHVITRETRNVKLHEITTPEVRTRQRDQLTWDELDALETIKQRARNNTGVLMDSAWKALQKATEHIFERKSVVKGHEVLAEALNRNPGFISLEKLRGYMTSAYKR